MIAGLRKALGAVALFTLAASCWLTLMTVVLGHPTWHAAVFALFIVQSTLTLGTLVSGGPAAAWVRPVLLAGAAGIFSGGGAMVAEQAGRFSLAQPPSPHFEGYALVIGLALLVQGLLTVLTFLATRSSAHT
jgi:hypothetical protein